MQTEVLDDVLAMLDVRAAEIAVLKDLPYGNCCWLPLTELEEASIEPIHHAFRIDMVAWQLDHGRRVGSYDAAMIERQLARTPTPRP